MGKREGHDRDPLALLDPVGGAAVDDDPAGASRARLDVGFQAVSSRDRGHQDPLPFPKSDGFHQIGGDFDAAFVIDIAIGDHGTVELGLEDLTEHGGGRKAIVPPPVKLATHGIPMQRRTRFSKCKCFASPSGPLRA